MINPGENPVDSIQLENWIKRLIRSQLDHAKFLNTLSLLEYIGARKIIKSQAEVAVSFEVLSHASEEIRHAMALKKVALRLSDHSLDSYAPEHLLCPEAAHSYIQGIDQGVAKKGIQVPQKDPIEVNYLLTTLLLEERAGVLYPLYDSYLAQVGFPGVLKAICREEDSHLKAVTSSLGACATDLPLSELRKMEEVEFARFFGALEQSLP